MSVRSFANLGGDSENNAGAVLVAIQPLQVAAASGLAVLVVVHQRKSGGEHGEAIRGSNALTGAVDIVVELERLPGTLASDPSARLLRAVGRFPSTPPELVVEYGEGGYSAAGGIGQVRETAETMRLLEALTETDATSAQLAMALGMSKATVQRRLEKCEANRLVDRRGEGKKGDPLVYSIRFIQPDPLTDESKSETDDKISTAASQRLCYDRCSERWAAKPLQRKRRPVASIGISY